jgi:hypothetical protein
VNNKIPFKGWDVSFSGLLSRNRLFKLVEDILQESSNVKCNLMWFRYENTKNSDNTHSLYGPIVNKYINPDKLVSIALLKLFPLFYDLNLTSLVDWN